MFEDSSYHFLYLKLQMIVNLNAISLLYIRILTTFESVLKSIRLHSYGRKWKLNQLNKNFPINMYSHCMIQLKLKLKFSLLYETELGPHPEHFLEFARPENRTENWDQRPSQGTNAGDHKMPA